LAKDWHRSAVSRIALGVSVAIVLRVVVGLNDVIMRWRLDADAPAVRDIVSLHGDIRIVGIVGGILAWLLIATGFTRIARVDRAVRTPALIAALAFLVSAAVTTTMILYFQSLGAADTEDIAAAVRWWGIAAATVGGLGWVAAVSAMTAASRAAKIDVRNLSRLAIIAVVAVWAVPTSRHLFRYDLPTSVATWRLVVMVASAVAMALVLILVIRYRRDYRPTS
jgi:hypothetical protein